MLNTWQVDHLVLDQDEGKLHIVISHDFNIDTEFTVEIKDRTHGVKTKGKCDLVLFVTNGDNDLRICTYEYNCEAEQYEQVGNTANLSEYVDVNLAEWRKFYDWLATIVKNDLVQEDDTNTFRGRWVLDNLERSEKYFNNLQERFNELNEQFEKNPIP